MDKRAYILSTIFTLLLIAGGFSLFGLHKNTMEIDTPVSPTIAIAQITPFVTATTPYAQDVRVHYTEKGFVPETITVRDGQSVTWINQSQRTMWIASNPHPLHNDYLGFDQRLAIDMGKSYTFTFTQKGKWGYHNHVNPEDTGYVIVE